MDDKLFHGLSFYEVLGLEYEASPEEVTDAYESKKEELDNLSGIDESVLQRALTLLDRAYGTLSDAKRRAAYDETLLEAAEGIESTAPGIALREFDTVDGRSEKHFETPTDQPNDVHSTPPPKLSGRLKATVTVPLSTLTRVMQDGGDLSLLGESSVEEQPVYNRSVVDRVRNEEQVSSFSSVSTSLESSRVRQEAQQRNPPSRTRRQSMELPRTAVQNLTADEDVPKKNVFDMFLVFCAFILPLATLLLVVVNFLLPET